MTDKNKDDAFAIVSELGLVLERKGSHAGLCMSQKLHEECNSTWDIAFKEDED